MRSLGFVETRHGIGTFVKEQTVEQNFLLSNASLETINDIISLLELRISLESEAVFLASERRKQIHIDKMKAALEDFERHISSDANDGTVKLTMISILPLLKLLKTNISLIFKVSWRKNYSTCTC